MRHTPGLWKESNGSVLHVPTGNTIANCHWAKDTEEFEANARLIAAAPDLMAACQDLVDLWAEWAENSSQLAEPLRRSIGMRVEQARVALAKAQGE